MSVMTQESVTVFIDDKSQGPKAMSVMTRTTVNLQALSSQGPKAMSVMTLTLDCTAKQRRKARRP